MKTTHKNWLNSWQPETPLECFDCNEPLTETATLLYWDEHPNGDGEPRCLDCKSIIAPEEVVVKPHWTILSTALFGATVGCLICAGLHHGDGQTGYWILAAIGGGNLGLLARICGH